METNYISFPDLGIGLELSRTAFTVYGIAVYWYGIIIALGFSAAAVFALYNRKKFGIKENDLIDALLFAVPLSIVGARLYYVLFNMKQFSSFLDVVSIRDGGLAIYGAVIAAVITVVVFCRIRKVRLGDLLDLGAYGFLIGQAIGRWGNFVNVEAYGSETSLPWRMEIFDSVQDAWVTVHPTFLYESLWNVLGFILLYTYLKHRKFRGEIFVMYLGWYGLGRAFIEGLRTDSLYLFDTSIRISQLVGVLSVIVALALLYYFRYKREPEDMTPTPLDEEDKKGKKVKSEDSVEEETEEIVLSEEIIITDEVPSDIEDDSAEENEADKKQENE